MAASSPPNGAKDPKGAILSALLTGDNSMKLITLVLVIVSGGTNWFATESNSSTNRDEIERARDQVNKIYHMIDDFEERQKALVLAAKDIGTSNSEQLANQGILLKKADLELAQLTQIIKGLDKERQRKNEAPPNL